MTFSLGARDDTNGVHGPLADAASPRARDTPGLTTAYVSLVRLSLSLPWCPHISACPEGTSVTGCTWGGILLGLLRRFYETMSGLSLFFSVVGQFVYIGMTCSLLIW